MKRPMEDGANIVRPRTLLIGALVFVIAAIGVFWLFIALLRNYV